MAKLTGYAAVAVINQNGKDYHFAIYEHGYKVGDKALLSNGCGVWEIKQIKDVLVKISLPRLFAWLI